MSLAISTFLVRIGLVIVASAGFRSTAAPDQADRFCPVRERIPVIGVSIARATRPIPASTTCWEGCTT